MAISSLSSSQSGLFQLLRGDNHLVENLLVVWPTCCSWYTSRYVHITVWASQVLVHWSQHVSHKLINHFTMYN